MLTPGKEETEVRPGSKCIFVDRPLGHRPVLRISHMQSSGGVRNLLPSVRSYLLVHLEVGKKVDEKGNSMNDAL